MYKPKIYTASKTHHAKLWRAMREDSDWEFADWTASWINHPDLEKGPDDPPPSDEVFREAWRHNINEVKASDFVLFYAAREPGQKGALIECGVALGLGIPVIAVCLTQDHSWAYHQNVSTFPSFRKAREYLFRFTTMIPPSRRRRTSDES